MNKATIILFFCLLIKASFAQVGVTNHLEVVKIKYPDGWIEKNDNGIFVYIVDSKDLNAYFVFAFDDDWYCVTSTVKPFSEEYLNEWITILKSDWKTINDKKWSLLRRDGLVIVCDQISLNEKGDCLLFYIQE